MNPHAHFQDVELQLSSLKADDQWLKGPGAMPYTSVGMKVGQVRLWFNADSSLVTLAGEDAWFEKLWLVWACSNRKWMSMVESP